MDDLISRAAVKQAFVEYKNSMVYLAPLEINRLVDLFQLIKDLPAVDAIPVEWLEEHDSEGNEYGRRYITVVEALSMWQKEQEAR